jgi:polyribonucleotide nucleotidyltransferase
MIECDAPQVPENLILQAFALGQKEIDRIINEQGAFLKTVAKVPQIITISTPSSDLIQAVKIRADDNQVSQQFFSTSHKTDFNALYNTLLEKIRADFLASHDQQFSPLMISMAWFGYVKSMIRTRALTQSIRGDGRDKETIRPLFCEV